MSLAQISRTIGAPLATTGTAAAVLFLLGGGGSTNILGTSLPKTIIYGLVVGAASGVTEVSKNYVVPMITNDPFSNTATHMVQPAITGLSAAVPVGALSGFKGNFTSAVTSMFMIGAGSQLVGNFAGESIDRFVEGLLPSNGSQQIIIA